MIDEEQIKQSLEAVLVPGVNRSIVGLNMVREIDISDEKVEITLASTGLSEAAEKWVKTKDQGGYQ